MYVRAHTHTHIYVYTHTYIFMKGQRMEQLSAQRSREYDCEKSSLIHSYFSKQ